MMKKIKISLFLILLLLIPEISAISINFKGKTELSNLVIDNLIPMNVDMNFNGSLSYFNFSKNNFLVKIENLKISGTLNNFPYVFAFNKINASSNNFIVNITRNFLNASGYLLLFLENNRYDIQIISLNATIENYFFDSNKIYLNLKSIEANASVNFEKHFLKASSLIFEIYADPSYIALLLENINLKKQNADLIKQLDNLTKTLQIYNETIQNLTKIINSLNSTLKESLINITKYKNLIENLTLKINSLNASITNKQNIINQLNSTIVSLKNNYTILLNEAAYYRQLSYNYSLKIQEMNSSLNMLRTKILDLNNTFSQLNAQVLNLQKEVGNSKSQIASLQNELNNKIALINNQSSIISSINLESSQLKKQLQESENKIQILIPIAIISVILLAIVLFSIAAKPKRAREAIREEEYARIPIR